MADFPSQKRENRFEKSLAPSHCPLTPSAVRQVVGKQVNKQLDWWAAKSDWQNRRRPKVRVILSFPATSLVWRFNFRNEALHRGHERRFVLYLQFFFVLSQTNGWAGMSQHESRREFPIPTGSNKHPVQFHSQWDSHFSCPIMRST